MRVELIASAGSGTPPTAQLATATGWERVVQPIVVFFCGLPAFGSRTALATRESMTLEVAPVSTCIHARRPARPHSSGHRTCG